MRLRDDRLDVEGLRPVSLLQIRAHHLAVLPFHVIGALLIAGAVVGAVLTSWWWIAALALIPLVLSIQGLALTGRRVRAMGYLDGEEELVLASGILLRSIVTVPYGRIQSVTIDEGPIQRRYGLASLTLSTASDTGTESISGLPREEAERLRALLTERGIERMAAL
ncbi:PH domain-containing protein [Brachybacterium sp. DNPG3]